MVMQIRDTLAVQMQMLTIRIFQGCQHATAFVGLGNVLLADAHLKGSNQPAGSLPMQQKTPHICQRRQGIAIKKQNQTNFASYLLENSFLPLKIPNPQWP